MFRKCLKTDLDKHPTPPRRDRCAHAFLRQHQNKRHRFRNLRCATGKIQEVSGTQHIAQKN